MASNFPSDLIRDIQTSMRRAAGMPLYDPSDPALPSVPSVEETVAALDPSLPDYLCCKRCHGGLCRGINSTLCIFCDAEQRVEGIPLKISFNTTAGYRKFLQSLNLDGSEMVNLEAESKESRKDQDSPKGGVTLSNLLDLELIWPRDVEKSDNNSSSKAPSQVAPVSLSGINLDTFFSDQENEVFSRSTTSDTTSNARQVSAHDGNLLAVTSNTSLFATRNETAASVQNATAEKFMPTEQNVNHHVSLFSKSPKNVIYKGQKLLDVVNSSDAIGGDSEDSFTDWETDFQSASSVIFETKSKSIDPFQYSADFQYAKSTVVTEEPVEIDPFQNSADFQSTKSTTSTVKSVEIDPFQKPTDFQCANYTAATTDSVQNDPFQNSADFQSADSTAASMESVQIDLFLNTSNSHSYNPTDLTMDSSIIDLFQNTAGFQSTKFETVATMSTFTDCFQSLSAPQSTNSGTVGTDSRHIDHLKNLITEKSDHSTNTGHSPSEDRFQDDMISHTSTTILKEFDQLESINSSCVGEVKNEKEESPASNRKSLNRHVDDLLDSWQDFTTSSNAFGNLSSLQPLANEKVHTLSSEDKSGDFENLEFGSFMQSDLVSGALNDIQSTSDVNSVEDGDSGAHRRNSSNEKTGKASTIYRGKDIDEDIPDASKYKLDMLLAQMPDLSFMLEEAARHI
ncbi:hypothetical protein KSP39_PZI002133 [Platanthera zijinensis]|uniref:DUF7815 domain-containing protein n=1 Tax=Platanthera zijinensis TaxID=2320716 RepID=A0AAP0GEJ8_9ASPA